MPLLRSEVVRCVECDLVADTAGGWKAYLGGGFEGEPVEVVVYCPTCAEREVGEAG
jgi:hypothetical protein